MRTWVLVAAGCALIAGVGSAEFMLGRSQSTSEREATQARRTTRLASAANSYRVASRAAKPVGYRDGTRAGRREGRARGRRLGTRKGAAEARKRAEEAAAQQTASSSPCPPGEQVLIQTGTKYCGRPGPARPEDCPAGQVPVGQAGACGRPDSSLTEPPPDEAVTPP